VHSVQKLRFQTVHNLKDTRVLAEESIRVLLREHRRVMHFEGSQATGQGLNLSLKNRRTWTTGPSRPQSPPRQVASLIRLLR